MIGEGTVTTAWAIPAIGETAAPGYAAGDNCDLSAAVLPTGLTGVPAGLTADAFGLAGAGGGICLAIF